jgi:glycine cleavage system H protein
MPVAGVVIEVNEALRADPALANTDPLGAGWFFKIRTTGALDSANLLDAAAYEALVQSA